MTYGYLRYCQSFYKNIRRDYNLEVFSIGSLHKFSTYTFIFVKKVKNYITVFYFFKGNALWVQFLYCACADQFTVGFWHKMASAKFLEEALTTDVDESAVNAIVGSLETSLVGSTPSSSIQQGIAVNVNQNHLSSANSNGSLVSSQKHGVLNGGTDSMNIILNSDDNKVISSSNTHQSASSSLVNTVVASLHGNVSSSGYVNQVSSNIGLVQSNITNLNKPQDAVKLVYPSNNQSATAIGGVNRITYPNSQTISLHNGNLGISPLTSHSVLSVSNANVQSVSSHNFCQAGANVTKQVGVVGMDQNKPTGTALVIKSGGNNHGPPGVPLNQGVVTVPMTLTGVNTALGTTTTSGVPGVVTLTKPVSQSVGSQQGIVGNNQSILPANVQILNVNTIRTGSPVQQGQKVAPQRVMTIAAPQMVGARPGQPGVRTFTNHA